MRDGRLRDRARAVLGERRKDIVLATKYSKPMGKTQQAGRVAALTSWRAVEASLARLKTDSSTSTSRRITIR